MLYIDLYNITVDILHYYRTRGRTMKLKLTDIETSQYIVREVKETIEGMMPDIDTFLRKVYDPEELDEWYTNNYETTIFSDGTFLQTDLNNNLHLYNQREVEVERLSE